MNDRRVFLNALGMTLLDCLSSRWINAKSAGSEGPLIFYAGRSGRFGYRTTSKVIIGGLLAPKNVANQLEVELETLAQELNFRIPLHFSTNKHNLEFYRQALGAAFDRHGLAFVGIRIAHPSWPKQRSVWEYWRRSAKLKALSGVSQKVPLHFCTLKRDFDADRRIYNYVVKALPPDSGFQIYPDAEQSPRAMQLSGLLAKCLNAPQRLESKDEYFAEYGSSHKNAMVRETFTVFELNRIDEEVDSDRLKLRHISF